MEFKWGNNNETKKKILYFGRDEGKEHRNGDGLVIVWEKLCGMMDWNLVSEGIINQSKIGDGYTMIYS